MKIRFPALLRPVAILAVAAAVAAAMISSRPVLTARDVEVPAPLVEVQRIAKGPVPVTVIAHGNVVSARQLNLTAQVTGRVLWKSERFEPGMTVDAGETLLRIDDIDYRLAVAEAKQALATAELSLADAKALKQAARVEEAGAAVAAARARIERAERDLANTEVKAPYAAIIDQQAVELGQFVSTGTNLGRIFGTERAEIRLPVAPQDIDFINPTMPRPVLLSSTVGSRPHVWQGRLLRVEARIDDQTRVYPVVVEVQNPLDTSTHEQPLAFGRFIRAEIPGNDVADAVLIPQSALHGETDVFLLENGALRRRTVTVERIADSMALVSDGLADGDLVVTTRLDLMYEGMQVALLDG